MNELKLALIGTDESTVSGSLGITDQRSDELEKAFNHGLIDCKTWTELMAHLAPVCKHMNEFAFICFNAGKAAERQNVMSQMKNALGPDGENG